LGSDSGRRALTQGPLIETWLMKNDFQPGGRPSLQLPRRSQPHWNGMTDREVLVVEPIGCSRS
jgi:hypothetical protein